MIGCEFEFPLIFPDGRSADQDAIQTVWQTFASRHPDWKFKKEPIRKVITGVVRERSGGLPDVINTDDGVGILEFSLAPQEDLRKARREFMRVFREMLDVTDDVGLVILGYGAQPILKPHEAYGTQKDLYLLIDQFIRYRVVGSTIAAHQVNIDCTPEEWPQQINHLSALSGLVIALTANSPVLQNKRHPRQAHRYYGYEMFTKRNPWTKPFLMNGILSPVKTIEEYFQQLWRNRLWVLPGTLPFEIILPQKPTFKEFLFSHHPWRAKTIQGKSIEIQPLAQHVNASAYYGWPAARMKYHLDDKMDLAEFQERFHTRTLLPYLRQHLTNLYLEYRPACAALPGEEMALPALVLGLMENKEQTAKLVARRTWTEWKAIRRSAIERGLHALHRGKPIFSLLERMIEIADLGLRRRQRGEEYYLGSLRRRLKTRRTPADEVLEAYEASGIPGLIARTRY